MQGLTIRESELVTFLQNWKQPFSPSFDDMMRGIGYKSKQNVHRLVTSLKRKGVVEYEFYRKRTIKLKTQRSEEDVILHCIALLERPDCQTAREILAKELMISKLKREQK